MKTLLTAFAIMCSVISLAQQVAPGNDQCSNAYFLTFGEEVGDSHGFSLVPQDSIITASSSTLVVKGSNVGASSDEILAPVCGTNYAEDGLELGLGVWYVLMGTGEKLTISTGTIPNDPNDPDTGLSAFVGSCSGGFTCVQGNEDIDFDNGDYKSELQFLSEDGTLYYVFVDGPDGAEGRFSLSLTFEPPSTPLENDDCQSAAHLLIGAETDELPWTSGSTVGAQRFEGTLSGTCAGDDYYGIINDVWYTFNSGVNTEVRFAIRKLSEEQPDLAFETILYKGDCDGQNIECISDPSREELENMTSWTVDPHTDYLMQVFEATGAEEPFEIILVDGENSIRPLEDQEVTISMHTPTGTEVLTLSPGGDDEDHTQVFEITNISVGGTHTVPVDEMLSIFSIDESSGTISTELENAAAYLSWLNINEEENFDFFELEVTMTDQGPGDLSSSAGITIRIDSEQSALTLIAIADVSFPENEDSSTAQAVTSTIEETRRIRYEIVSGNEEGLFEIHAISGLVSLTSPLDFESRSSYELVVKGRVLDFPTIYHQVPILIQVEDKNDPIEIASLGEDDNIKFGVSYQQLVASSGVIGEIIWSDQDLETNYGYEFALACDDLPLDVCPVLTLDVATGALTINDFESFSNAVDLYIEEGGEAQSLILTVQAGNLTISDSKGELVNDTQIDFELSILLIPNLEIQNADMYVPEQHAFDEDGVLLIGELQVPEAWTGWIAALEENNFFALEDEEGTTDSPIEIVRYDLDDELDYEKQALHEYQLEVRGFVDEEKQVGVINTFPLRFRILNVIEGRDFQIGSRLPEGNRLLVGHVEGSPVENLDITYAISDGNDAGVFDLEENGNLWIEDDRNLSPGIHVLEVHSRHLFPGGEYNSVADVSFTVYGGTWPVLSTKRLFVNENSGVNKVIGGLQSDSSNGATYELVNGEEEATILDDGGTRLVVNQADYFDFEKNSQLQVLVKLQSLGAGNLEYIDTLTIEINDVNEFAPTTAYEGIPLVQISENTSEGVAIFEIQATDQEEHQVIQFEITSGNTDDAFAIDSTSGVISVNNSAAIDFEDADLRDGENSYYHLDVTLSNVVEPVEELKFVQKVKVQIQNLNEPPVFELEDLTGDELAEISFQAEGRDPDIFSTQTLSYTLDEVSLISGMSIDASTGMFSWTPAENQDGVHAITVTVSDGEVEVGEEFSITVAEVNTPPTMNNIDDKEVNELALLILEITGSDADIPANELTYTLDETSVSKGMEVDPETGAFDWTPGETQDGLHMVTVTVSDGALEVGRSFEINVAEVNTAPAISTILDKEMDELTSITFFVSASDSDVPANTLSYALDATSASKGMEVDPVTAAFNWTPEESQDGLHIVTVTVSDGALEATGTFEINVVEVNVAPILGAVSDKQVDELTSLVFTVTASDEDVPVNGLTYSLDATSVSKGMEVDPVTGGFDWTPEESQDGLHIVTVTVSDAALEATGTFEINVVEVNVAPILDAVSDKQVDELTSLIFSVAASDEDVPVNGLTYSLDEASVSKGMTIDTAGDFMWSPEEAQDGTHLVSIIVSDGELNTEETFEINVSEVNEAPVLTLESKEIDEHVQLSFKVEASDSDVPANNLSYSVDAASVSKGMTIDIDNGQFSWEPSEEREGLHQVEITVSDGDFEVKEVFEITVLEVNEAPILAIEAKEIDEEQNFSFTISANDSDLPKNKLTYSLDDSSIAKGMFLNESTGLFSWFPSEVQDGTHTVTVAVSDQTIETKETFEIVVLENNVAPTLTVQEQSVREGQNLIFFINADDPDIPGNVLAYFIDETSISKGMAVESQTGVFSWTPLEDQDGIHSVTVTVSDGALATSVVFQVVVSETNSSPVVELIENKIIDELADFTFQIQAFDPDVPSQELSFSIDDTSISTGMTIDEKSGLFSWRPTEDQNGEFKVSVSVSDGELVEEAMFLITVLEVNTSPVVSNPIDDKEFDTGFQSANIDLGEIFEDAEGDELSFEVSTSIEGVIAATIEENELLLAEEGAGETDVTVTVVDGNGGVSSTSFKVTVSDPPLSVNDSGLLIIYPNPTSGFLMMDINNVEIGQILVYNVVGQKLIQKSVSRSEVAQGKVEFDLSDLPDGTYYIRFHGEAVGGYFKIVKESE